jgi:tetratricopeptide (TPR) repeat protein
VANSASGENLHTLILKGKLAEVRDSLSMRASAAVRDGNTLFYQSLVETDGAQAVRLMEAALEASVHPRYQEEIVYRLAQYYLLRNDFDRLARLLVDYRSRWETGRYAAEMSRYSLLTDEHGKELESALRQCDRYLLARTEETTRQWGQIDKARLMKANGKSIGSNEMLRQLSRQKQGEGIPQALYLLGMEAIERGRADDAIFYYNIMREGYPAAVGLDEMLVGLGNMSTDTKSGNRAEQVTGTYYSVKVGVFSESANARKQADKFQSYGRKVDINSKQISGRDYSVVYVGRFDDYEEALRFKEQLEATHHETYQVVAR